jgi:hypothetical protein
MSHKHTWNERAFIILAGLKESVQWELAPSIMKEIGELIDGYPAGAADVEKLAREIALPDELLGGAVKVIRPTDLRNRVGMYMMERGVKMGRNVDPGDVQDMIEKFVTHELRRSLQPPLTQSWISVADGMPNFGVTVLVVADEKTQLGYRREYFKSEDEKDWHWQTNILSYYGSQRDRITHWRPLPEPPPPAKEKA